MRYSPLVRRLVQASGEARVGGYDIADSLADRCLSETDIVRRTLYNAVCDPRFKLHADSSQWWRKTAREYLETFADKLSKMQGLTPDIAQDVLDSFLDRWLELMLMDRDVAKKTIEFDRKKEEEKEKPYDLEDALKDFMPELADDDEEDKTPGDEEGEDNIMLPGNEPNEEKLIPFGNKDGEEMGAAQSETEQEDAERESSGSGKDEENAEPQGGRDEETVQSDFGSGRGNGGFGRGGGPGAQNRIEDRFLKRIPKSLLDLAKQIGRSGDDSQETTGTFQTASKSDIAGITTGNDLSSVLPSELAMLATPATENIFFNNFISRRLQVFSSASKSTKPGKKQNDGPIIICIDTSGSMTGEPVIMAKALSMAICIIAQRQKRKVILIKYSDSYDGMVVRRLTRQSDEVAQFLSIAEQGGNNEDSMFRWLFNELLPSVDNDFNSADVLCITDFGWDQIRDDVMETIGENKRRGMLFYGLNISPGGFFDNYDEDEDESSCEGCGYDFYQYRKIIDHMWGYKDGECFEYKNKENSNV